MLKPKEMVQVLIAGPLDLLPKTVHTLYDLQVLHIVDFRGEDDTFRLGRPLEKASEVSEALLKLRSIAGVLELDKVKGLEVTEVGPDAPQRLATLELNIREEDESRKKIEGLIMDLTARIEALSPFAALGLDLSYYHGYDNLEVFVGRLSRELVGLDEMTNRWELFSAKDAIALFVERQRAGEVGDLLTGLGFTPLEVPGEEGDPGKMLKQILDEREKWKGRLQAVQERLSILRERFGSFVLSAEGFLTQEIEKAEAPLRFATSDHTFIAEGWIPKGRWEEVQSRLGETGNLYVGLLAEAEEEPPVLLDNPKPVRPFELLTHLFSTPSYKEIDPTLTLFLIFPIFFGFMIGDLGYGATLAIIGALGLRKVRSTPDLRKFMAIILIAGIATAIFGAFIFADAFGIPFNAPAEEHGPGEAAKVSWSGLLGVEEIPIKASIHKLTDVVDMLILSIVAAVLHLGLGFVMGFFNEFRHSKKHAAAKVAWLMVLLGLFIALTARVSWTRVGRFLWSTVLSPIPLDGLELFGFHIPWAAFILLLTGTVLVAIFEFLVTQNPVAVLEVASLLANMISYTRLAGIAVAKAAIADALNNAIFQGLLFSSSVIFIAIGVVVLILSQMMILLLGALSAGIQALRLNYVEFFMKFFKGNGVPFQPFGAQATGTI
ncbi:MAG: V-type ATP synthase subunit I [Thermoplasmata archaeon]